MQVKKIISIITTVVITLSCLSGCGKIIENDKSTTGNSEVAMGRYIEKDFNYPEGVNDSDCISLLMNPEGNTELFAYDNSSGTLLYVKYIQTDNQWSKEKEEALNAAVFSDNIVQIQQFFYGEDGKLYMICMDADFNNALYRQSENGSYELIKIAKFKEIYEDWGITYFPSDITVLANGMISILYMQGGIDVYTPDGQKKVIEFDTGQLAKMAADNNMLYYTSLNSKELLSYNTETEHEGIKRTIETEISDDSQIIVENGIVYICDSAGVHQNLEGSSIWETIIDGQLCSLSAPSYFIKALLVGTQKEFYVQVKDEKGIPSYFRYVYDEKVSSVPSKELTIYALEDNRTIRQAIVDYQKVNPDVYVNFRVADAAGGENTKADYIKALNTELLAKKGADILILDGLPIDSYIEKGVLEDMGSLITPLVDSGELLSNIAKNFYQDDKIYGMPLRFTVPIIYGESETVKMAGDLDKLSEQIKNSSLPIFAKSNYRALAEWFLLLNYNSIVDENKEINVAALEKFLERVNEIALNIGASEDVEIDKMNSAGVKGTVFGYWVSAVIKVATKKVTCNIEEIGSVMDMTYIFKVLKEQNGDFSSINNLFRPKMIIGINSASTQKELAKEFVGRLFSKEMQEADLMEGFSLNKSVLEEKRKWNDENYMASLSSGDTDYYTMEATYPTEEERNELFETIYSLTTPMENDAIVIDMILDEAENYLKGRVTARQAAENSWNNTKTYLAE